MIPNLILGGACLYLLTVFAAGPSLLTATIASAIATMLLACHTVLVRRDR